MAGRYFPGETKVRPGVYFRQENGSYVEPNGVTDGIVAVAFKSNWGPLGEVVTIKSPAEIEKVYGNRYDGVSNVGILHYIFEGGASEIKAVRVGTGGTKASIQLKKAVTSGTGTNVITLTAKYPSSERLYVTIRDHLTISTHKQCIIYAGTKELCSVNFRKTDGTTIDEVGELVDAIMESPGCVVTAVAGTYDLGDAVAPVTQEAFSVGASPTITSTDYSAALTLLEACAWSTVCVDSNDTTIHALVKAFVDRVNDAGLLGMAVIGEPVSVTLDTRMAHAAAFNSENMIYCLNGFKSGVNEFGDDEVYQGWVAAAVVAGYVSYIPSNDSVTHKVIPGATDVYEALTNTQVINALQSGCIVFTASSSGEIWIEQGINTLVDPGIAKDEGWKKIRRTKARFELITRINVKAERIIGRINNDSNGRQTVIALANGVINEMVAEGKLLNGYCAEDTLNPAIGSSAWFILNIVDLDSIEHVYLTYRFHFSED